MRIEDSKDRQAEHFGNLFWAGAFKDTPDTLRHWEILGTTDSMIRTLDCGSVLTVGDNYCRDAAYIKRTSGCYAIASDLRMGRDMDKAVKLSHVDKVIDADVENLPMEDNSVDLVFAKEAFHHWPRPMLGVYEMLRVASKCVILIEPTDTDKNQNNYERAGNYIHRISVREIIKAAWSLYLPAVAYRTFYDPYKEPFNYEEWTRARARRKGSNLTAIAIYKTPADWSLLEDEDNISLRPPNPFNE